MSTICMTAAPYCYGPTAKLLCVAEELAKRHSLLFVGQEPSLSFARTGPFASIIQNEDRDNWSRSAQDALCQSDMLISFLDYRSLRVAASRGVPSIFFDTLAWLRNEPPPFTQLSVRYIAQRFFVEAQKGLTAMLPRLTWVGPVLPREPEERMPGIHCGRNLSRKGHLMVNFGGLLSPVMHPGADAAYMSWIIRILSKVGADAGVLTICVPLHLRDHIDDFTRLLPNARFQCFDSIAFQHALSRTSLLITVPGLEVALEAMHVGIPIIFLPPHNGSQLLQGEAYLRLRIGLVNLMPSFLRGAEFRSCNTSETTVRLQKLNGLHAHDDELISNFATDINAALRWVENNPESLAVGAAANRALLEGLGMSGRTATAAIVEHCTSPLGVKGALNHVNRSPAIH